ncbi:MAG: S8/S53 family peptidase [Candidatus Dependentiae bacterium]|nr:S8/S53 family peptidase [Candidatus Dependentiae bacterium]
MKKILLFFLNFIYSPSLHCFNFFPENISYCSRQEYESLMHDEKLDPGFVKTSPRQDDVRMQNISKDFLWHLKIPTVGLRSQNQNEILLWDLAPKKGEGIKIAVLDTKINENLYHQCQKPDSFENSNKIEPRETICDYQLSYRKNQNHLTQLMKKNNFFKKCVIKNHGNLTCGIIRQLAPYVTIIPISIMDDDGGTDIKSLCRGLQQAFDNNVDIVHLGLKIADDICDKHLENKELITLLQKFSYVVVAAGNNYACVKKVAFPACLPNLFFSVGAFECNNNNYHACSFSQCEENVGPNFLLPGHRILCPLWIDETDDYIFVHTSGTSIASAMMTGFLALLLSEFQHSFTREQIEQVIKSCSKKLDMEWNEKVIFGTVDMRKTALTLKSLQQIIKKVSACFYKKNFLKFVEAIKEYCDFDNKNVNISKAYADKQFRKKIDRDLYLLVKDSNYLIKENIWKKNHT